MNINVYKVSSTIFNMEHRFKMAGRTTEGVDFIICSCNSHFYDGNLKKDELDTAKNRFLSHLEDNGEFELALEYMEVLVK